MLIKPAEDRIEGSITALLIVSSDQRLSPSLAGKLYGKLMFMSSQYFGRLGRALLRAFSRRQHEFQRAGLNPQLIPAISFLITHMRDICVRKVPLDFCEAPLFLSYAN